MQRAFITGGSGFVGGRLLGALKGRGVPTAALARSDDSAARVTKLGAEAVRGDLDTTDALAAGMRGCDVVFHAAAHTDQWDPLDVHMRITARGTEHVLAAAKTSGVQRFVHVSTEAVLADGHPIVRADETRPLPAAPVGAYAITKGAAERAVLAANGPALATVVVRPRFVWGPDDTNLLDEFAEAVERGRFSWIGGGRYLTSTCHVDNVVEALLLAAERGAPGAVYFVTDGAPVEFHHFITELLATRGITVPRRSIPRWLARAIVGATAWMKRPPLSATAFALMAHEVTIVDAKARRELGYVGRVSVEAGLAAMRGGAGAKASGLGPQTSGS